MVRSGKGNRVGKFVLVTFLIFLLVAGFIVFYIFVLKPGVDDIRGARAVGLDKKEKSLEEKEKELDEKEAALKEQEEKQLESQSKGVISPFVWVIICLASIGIILVFFFGFKTSKKISGLKDVKEMTKIALEYLGEKGLDYQKGGGGAVKSYFVELVRSFPNDPVGIFLLQANFKAYRPGIDTASSACITIASNNNSPFHVWSEFPNRTKEDIAKVLFNRHFARKGIGLPFMKTQREELFPGLGNVQVEAMEEHLKELAKEGY